MGKMTVLGLRKLTTPGRSGDGDGLWFQVRDAEHRSWLFRYTLHGRAREMGLGPFPDVGLAEARDLAAACRRQVRDGIDPIERRRAVRAEAKAAAAISTFKEVAAQYVDAKKAGWRNDKHVAQWDATLGTYVYPVFGARQVSTINTADVLRALEPIWAAKPETASRLRGRIEAVLDYAAAKGWRTGDNPARWKGHLANLLASRKSIARVEHHAALPRDQLAAFLLKLITRRSTAATALRFVIYTASRTGEALGATWQEIDTDKAVWTVPAERMKAGREHRVPLSPAALAQLAEMAPLRTKPTDYVFAGARRGRPLSNMALAMLLRRMGHADITTHGFRSTFRDWIAEETDYPNEVAEMALAHSLADKTEAAYRRGDLFAKRAAMMADWAAFCGS